MGKPRKTYNLSIASGRSRLAVEPLGVLELHNYQYSPLYRLPEELLVGIILHLRDDVLAPFCLRRVSRLLRRLVLRTLVASHRRETWLHPGLVFPGILSLGHFSFWDLRYQYEKLKAFRCQHHEDLRARLRKDQLCARCLKFSDHRPSVWTGCKFGVTFLPPEHHLCGGCLSWHPAQAFSTSELMKLRGDAVCVGREGAVRLCEHKVISWADVESRVAQSMASNAAIKFEMSCDHPRHKTCPVDPSAGHRDSKPTLLLGGTSDGRRMFIRLSWTAHEVLAVDNQGRFSVSAVRSMFLRHREGCARFIIPPRACIGSPTEMRCFGSSGCTCLSQDDDQDCSPAGSKGYKNCLGCWNLWGTKKHRFKDDDLLKEQVEVSLCPAKQHKPGEQCIVTKYSRTIRLDDVTSGTYNPSHEWFHALDPDSYVLSDFPSRHLNVWPTCKNTACRNYYRSRQTLSCTWRRNSDWELHGRHPPPSSLGLFSDLVSAAIWSCGKILTG